MPNDRPFVPVESAERSRLGLRANLADCRRIREVWLQRKLDYQNRDSGYSTSVGIGCLNELRAVAEEEVSLALGLLDQARKAIEAALPHAPKYRDAIVASESINGDPDTLDADSRGEVEMHDAAIAGLKDTIAAIDAANQE